MVPRSQRSCTILILGILVLTITGCIDPTEEETEGPKEDLFDYYFNAPTWDATYINESIMDQFTAGLNHPDESKFNISSDDPHDSTAPPVYWRLGSLSNYEYTGKVPYTTGWNTGIVFNRTLSPIPNEPNDTFSNILSSSSRTARFQVEMPINYNRSTLATIHPNFLHSLPVPWNGRYGSYVSSDSIQLLDENSDLVSPLSKKVVESYPSILSGDLAGVSLQLELDDSITGMGTVRYTVDYQAPDLQTVAMYSLSRSEADYLNCGLNANSWNSIKSLYLQLPGIIPVGYSTYQGWAPTVTQNAINWNDSLQTVFEQAYSNLVNLGNMSTFTFDMEMWLANQYNVEMDHPAQYEDYNEWFMQRGSGVSIHFASALTTINRLQNIPSRVAIGYLVGNDSYIYAGKRAISSRFLHAWTEVLVPIDPNPLLPGDEYVDWISFDPLLPVLSAEYGMETPMDVVTPMYAENHLFIRSDYDLEGNGLIKAYTDHALAQITGEWIFERCTVNNSVLGNGSALQHGESIKISSRLIGISSPTLWFPAQAVNVSFYIGGKYDNHSFWIEDGGTFIGSVITDYQGIATLFYTIDIVFTGIREIRFWTVVTFNENSPNEYTHRAWSLWYVITL